MATNEIHVTIQGNVAQPPRALTTRTGASMTIVRIASTQRYYKDGQGWTDGRTSWFNVKCFNRLAEHAASCLQVGHPVIVTGRLSTRDWDGAERSGTDVEVEATTIGHDLRKGTSAFLARSTSRPAEEPAQPTAAVDTGRDTEREVERAAEGGGAPHDDPWSVPDPSESAEHAA